MQRTLGADLGPVWHTRVWPRHGTCVAYHVVKFVASAWDLCGVPCRKLNDISLISCVLIRAPGCSVVIVGYMSYACAGSSCT